MTFSNIIQWRRGWDSNPRNPQRSNGFQDRLLKPLGHPSKLKLYIESTISTKNRYAFYGEYEKANLFDEERKIMKNYEYEDGRILTKLFIIINVSKIIFL